MSKRDHSGHQSNHAIPPPSYLQLQVPVPVLGAQVLACPASTAPHIQHLGLERQYTCGAAYDAQQLTNVPRCIAACIHRNFPVMRMSMHSILQSLDAMLISAHYAFHYPPSCVHHGRTHPVCCQCSEHASQTMHYCMRCMIIFAVSFCLIGSVYARLSCVLMSQYHAAVLTLKPRERPAPPKRRVPAGYEEVDEVIARCYAVKELYTQSHAHADTWWESGWWRRKKKKKVRSRKRVHVRSLGWIRE